MKRELNCFDCSEKWRRVTSEPDPAGPTFSKFVTGIALSEYHCDGCGVKLNQGSACIAFSLWTPRSGPYYEWEHDYIEVKEEDVAWHKPNQ